MGVSPLDMKQDNKEKQYRRKKRAENTADGPPGVTANEALDNLIIKALLTSSIFWQILGSISLLFCDLS